MTWQTVPLGDVLRQTHRPQYVEDPASALLISVRLHGKGAVRRTPGEGKAPKPFIGNRGANGQFVYSRIWCRRGAMALIPDELDGVVVTSEFPIFDINTSRLYPQFLSYVVQSADFLARVEGASRGAAGQNRVREREFLNLHIPLPPLPEQRRIAAILDEADALRQTSKRLALAAMASAEAAFRELERGLDSRDTVPLSDIAVVSSGITKGRKEPQSVLFEVPYMTVANVQDKRLDLASVKTMHVSTSEVERYRLRDQDLLLTEGGDPDKLGRGVVWHDDLPLSIHQNHVFRVRRADDATDMTWLNWEIGSEYGKRYFLRAAKQTTGIATINSSQLKQFPVRVASKSAIEGFRSALDAASSFMNAGETRSRELDALFASLQHRAFRGEL